MQHRRIRHRMSNESQLNVIDDRHPALIDRLVLEQQWD
jgi:hypothetical protein